MHKIAQSVTFAHIFGLLASTKQFFLHAVGNTIMTKKTLPFTSVLWCQTSVISHFFVVHIDTGFSVLAIDHIKITCSQADLSASNFKKYSITKETTRQIPFALFCMKKTKLDE